MGAEVSGLSTGPEPVATIVTVLDHKVGEDESWDRLRATIRALSEQQFREPVEIMLVETEGKHKAIPPDIQGLVSDLRIIATKGTSSFDLKNAGVEAARSDFVVILDADCRPAPGWWRAVYEHHAAHPEAAVISGRTFYEGGTLLSRGFALIDRTYVDVGQPGRTRAISNNNAGFRRQVLLDHPFSNEVGPFGSEPHSARIKASGAELQFEPKMIAYHAFSGWDMVREERRHIGFSLTRYRQLHPEAPNGWMLEYPSLWKAYLVAASTVSDLRRSFRHAADYGVRWFQLPYVWLCSLRAHVLSLKGVRVALDGGWVGGWSSYR